MNAEGDFRNLTVKVNCGSGCFFQVNSSEYTYVLTAKHNIKDKNNIDIKKIILLGDGSIIEKDLEVIYPPFFHSDVNKDAAIIKVKKQIEIPNLVKCNYDEQYSTQSFLCGHPEVRGKGDSYRINQIKIFNKKQFGYIEGELVPFSTHGEVAGQSGGGILNYKNGAYFIKGIQKGMAVSDEKETLSRIHFMPMTFFEDIVNENKSDLVELIPPFISSFDELVEYIYSLNSFLFNKEIVKDELKAIARELTNSLSPKDIIKNFGDRVLVFGEPKVSIYEKSLWIGMLELFTMIKLQESEGFSISIEDVGNVNKKNKVIYGSVIESWEEIIHSLYKSDLTELEKDSSVFVVSSNDVNPVITTIEPKIIQSIATVPPKRVNVNHATIQNPFEDIKLRHIYDLQKRLIEKRTSFMNANACNIEELLKNETKDII